MFYSFATSAGRANLAKVAGAARNDAYFAAADRLARSNRLSDFTDVTDGMNLRVDQADIRTGARLRQRRVDLGLSQMAVAAGLRISFQQLQKYERGTNRVAASRLSALADLLQVPVTYFLDPMPAEIAEAKEMIDLLTSANDPLGRQLNRSFARIKSRELRRQIIGIIEAIACDAERRS